MSIATSLRKMVRRDLIPATLLYAAVSTGNKSIAIPMIAAGVKDDCRAGKETCLHLACRNGNIDVIESLLQQSGSDPNRQDDQKRTPMHHASESRIIGLLIRFGASPNIRDVHGNTPLHHAIQSNRPDLVNAILSSNNVETNLTNNDGLTPLKIAIMTRNRNTAIQLILAGTKDASRPGSESGLHIATRNGDIEIVDHLLRYSASELDNLDIHLRSPIHYASDIRIIELLLRFGASPNLQDVNGSTPLHNAVRSDRADIVECLLSIKDGCSGTSVSIDIVDKENMTALSIAKSLNRKNILQLFKKSNGNWSCISCRT